LKEKKAHHRGRGGEKEKKRCKTNVVNRADSTPPGPGIRQKKKKKTTQSGIKKKKKKKKIEFKSNGKGKIVGGTNGEAAVADPDAPTEKGE